MVLTRLVPRFGLGLGNDAKLMPTVRIHQNLGNRFLRQLSKQRPRKSDEVCLLLFPAQNDEELIVISYVDNLSHA